MSRIGNKAITIPAGVEITIAEGNEVTVKGPKGTLTKKFSPLMDIAVEDGVLTVKRPNEEKQTKQRRSYQDKRAKANRKSGSAPQAEASVEGPLLAPVRAPEPEDAGVKRQDEHVAADEEAQKRQAEEAERAAKEESERRAREEAAQRAREEAEREEAERAAKEEADRVRGEAVALQAEVAKVAGADGFKDRKAQLDAVCVQADEAYKAKRWDDAKVKFEEYAEKSRNVLTLDGERHKADAARKSAAKEKKKAESYGAETHAATEWGKALADWKRAVEEFDGMEFSQAETSFGDAADGFRRCVDRVIARVRRRDEIRREISASVGDVPRHGSVDRVLEEERRRAAAAFLERTAGANRCRHCGAVVRYQIAGRYCPACRGDLLED